MAHDVFISYTSKSPKDKMAADAVRAMLTRKGIRCWLDSRDIHGGEDWSEEIIPAVKESRALVLIFSASTNDSHYVRQELVQAVESRIPVIPFRIEDVNPSHALKLLIGTFQRVDALTEPLEPHLERLASSVQRLLGKPHSVDLPSPPPASPRFVPRRLGEVATALIVLLLGAVGLLQAFRTGQDSGVSSEAAKHMARAEALYQSHELEFALNAYTRAIELEPGAAPAFLGRAMVRLDRAELDEAVADAEQAIALSPELAQAYAVRAHAWSGKREYERALVDAAKALELDPRSSRAYVVRAFVSLARHEPRGGLADAKKAVELDEQSPWAYLARANAYLELFEFDEAVADYNQALQLSPKLMSSYIGRARYYLSQGKLQEALADTHKALESGPVADALSVRAAVRVAQQDYEQAVADASEALQLDPASSEAYAWRALAHALTNHRKKALEDANEALRLDKGQAVALLARAKVWFLGGELEQAIADASRALELNSRLGQAYVVRGSAYTLQGNQEQALKDLDAGVRLTGADGQTARMRALLLMRTRQYPEAISLLEGALQKNPNDAKLYETLSSAYLMKGEVELARSTYLKGQALDPSLSGGFQGRPITAIRPGSQAERLGLKQGDLVLSYETTLRPTFEQLMALTQQPGSDKRELTVVRDQKVHAFKVDPGSLGLRISSKH